MPSSRLWRWCGGNLYVELRFAGEEPARQVELLRGSLAIRTPLGDREDAQRVTGELNERSAAQDGGLQEEAAPRQVVQEAGS